MQRAGEAQRVAWVLMEDWALPAALTRRVAAAVDAVAGGGAKADGLEVGLHRASGGAGGLAVLAVLAVLAAAPYHDPWI